MLGDVRARKYSKTGARTRSILENFAFDTTLKPSHPHKRKWAVIGGCSRLPGGFLVQELSYSSV